MNYFFNLFNFSVSHWLFNISLNRNYSRNLNYSLHYFFHDFRNFNDFVVDLETFQDIIHINSVRNLLVYHRDDRFIDFWSVSCLVLHFLELLHKRFKKNSLMKLNSSLFVCIVGVGIFYFDQRRYKLDYLNDFIKSVVVNSLEDVSVEKFNKGRISFTLDFRVFGVDSVNLSSQLSNQFLGLFILDRLLDHFFFVLHNMNQSFCQLNINIFVFFNNSAQFFLVVDFDSFQLQIFHMGFQHLTGGFHLLLVVAGLLVQ